MSNNDNSFSESSHEEENPIKIMKALPKYLDDEQQDSDNHDEEKNTETKIISLPLDSSKGHHSYKDQKQNLMEIIHTKISPNSKITNTTFKKLLNNNLQPSQTPPSSSIATTTALFPGDDVSLSYPERFSRVFVHIFVAPFFQGMMYGLGESIAKYMFQGWSQQKRNRSKLLSKSVNNVASMPSLVMDSHENDVSIFVETDTTLNNSFNSSVFKSSNEFQNSIYHEKQKLKHDDNDDDNHHKKT